MNTRVLVPLVLLISLQGLDLALHALAGGIEPMRAVSNAIITAGAIAAVLAPRLSSTSIIVSAIVYLALNVLFVFQHGLVNPATERLNKRSASVAVPRIKRRAP